MGADAFYMFKLANMGYCCSQILTLMHLEKMESRMFRY
jgi:hypothetical protein